jgi:hypothetical protein
VLRLAERTFNAGRMALPAIRGQTAFEHVSFRYRLASPKVLHEVTFSVQAAQIVGIVGPSRVGQEHAPQADLTPLRAGERAGSARRRAAASLRAELVYAARVSLDRSRAQMDETPVSLTTSIAVTVAIRTGERNVLLQVAVHGQCP